MPSIGRTPGLIWVVAVAACLAAESRLEAQTHVPGNSSYDIANPPPASYYAASPEAAFPQQRPAAQGSLAPPAGRSPLRLSPPGRSNDGSSVQPGGSMSAVTMFGSLALVLGVFLLVAWCVRRTTPAGSMALPEEVFEVLGRATMAGRQQACLLRLGKKLILVSVTPNGAETLAEVTEPLEVDRLAGICQQARPNSATVAFRQVFGQLARQRPEPEYPLPDYSSTIDRGDARPAQTGLLQTTDGLENRDV